jgi:hypothetical protein
VKIFVSYPTEHRSLADRLAVGLRQAGHEVFFDRDQLPAGEGFHAEIRRFIEKADLFVFLLSPASVEPTSYARTELGFARQRFPDPSGRVLPVMVEPVPIADVPAYLSAVTILQPQGDQVAEALAQVSQLTRLLRRRRRVRIGLASGLSTVLALAVVFRPHAAATTLITGTVIDVTTDEPVEGAEVTLNRDGRPLASDTSDKSGKFSLPFTGARLLMAAGHPTDQRQPVFKIVAKHANFATDTEDLAGAPGQQGWSRDLRLLPAQLSRCSLLNHTIVVGHFSPPSGKPTDLASRIRRNLDEDLKFLQQENGLRAGKLPVVRTCDDAAPPSAQQNDGFARALNADALLIGDARGKAAPYTLNLTVADRFGLFPPHGRESVTTVRDLDDPLTAHLDPDLRKAILTAVVVGYERADQFAECVDATNAAHKILASDLPPAIADAGQRCQSHLPQQAFLKEHRP